jgi:hypothetical protein
MAKAIEDTDSHHEGTKNTRVSDIFYSELRAFRIIMRESSLLPHKFLARSLEKVKPNPGNPSPDSALASSGLRAGPQSEKVSFPRRRESRFFLLRDLRINIVESFRGFCKFYGGYFHDIDQEEDSPREARRARSKEFLIKK